MRMACFFFSAHAVFSHHFLPLFLYPLTLPRFIVFYLLADAISLTIVFTCKSFIAFPFLVLISTTSCMAFFDAAYAIGRVHFVSFSRLVFLIEIASPTCVMTQWCPLFSFIVDRTIALLLIILLSLLYMSLSLSLSLLFLSFLHFKQLRPACVSAPARLASIMPNCSESITVHASSSSYSSSSSSSSNSSSFSCATEFAYTSSVFSMQDPRYVPKFTINAHKSDDDDDEDQASTSFSSDFLQSGEYSQILKIFSRKKICSDRILMFHVCVCSRLSPSFSRRSVLCSF